MKVMSTFLKATVVPLILATGSAKAADTTLLLGHTGPTNSVFQESAQHFADTLATLSNNTMAVDIVGGGSLGGIPEHWAQLQAGDLDLHLFELVGVSFMREAADFSVLFAPYLFRDQDHLHRFVASPLFDTMMSNVEDLTGIHYVGYVGDRFPRAVSTRNTEVTRPEDLSGLRVRVAMHPAIVATYEAFGAVPTPLPSSELLIALRTGTVDGQDQGLVDYLDAGYDAASPYYSPINTVYAGMGLWMSGQRWSSLTEEQQSWVTAAAQSASDQMNAAADARMAQALQLAEERGVHIATPDIALFQAAVAPVIERLDGTLWRAGLYAEIQGL